MSPQLLWKLKKAARLRAMQTIEAATPEGDKVIAQPGEVGTVEEPGGHGSHWPTVRFPGGSSIVFDDEVEVAP